VATFERGAPREPRAHLDFRDLAVFDLVEQRDQPSDFSTKRKVRGGHFFAGLRLNVQPHIYKNGRGRALQNWFTIPDAEVENLPEVHGLAKPDQHLPGLGKL
jgi:hypothetical protein